MSVESVSTGIGSKSRLRLPKKQLSRLKGTESIASSVASNLNRWVRVLTPYIQTGDSESAASPV